MAKEERLLLKIFKNWRHSWIGHRIRHNEFVVSILEGAVSGKKAVGRPRLQYLKQVARKAEADSYTALKRMACNSSRWKAANQAKEWRLRRRRRRRRCCARITWHMQAYFWKTLPMYCGIARTVVVLAPDRWQKNPPTCHGCHVSKHDSRHQRLGSG